jgi:methylenetetrahydrofolate dehydrogenase (NADP+) / methenyltetrahydrofolate cyclohydrolase
MTAKIIDGAALAKQLRNTIRETLETLGGSGSSTNRPGLTVVLVGDNQASRVYVRNKIKACEEAGFTSRLIELPASTSQESLLAQVGALNDDAAVHGILVQLPLPAHIDDQTVIEAISPAKDVDGFHVASAGALMTGLPGFAPCTPAGIMEMLRHESIPIEGRHAVVVGRSNIVGKPMAMLLLQAGATVTICHSKTPDLAAMTRQADILVAAVGRVNLITADMVKPGACVIDVGMNRDAQGKLCGDVDFAGVRQVAGSITPVPGGVGPMTIAMLLANTLKAFRLKAAATR